MQCSAAIWTFRHFSIGRVAGSAFALTLGVLALVAAPSASAAVLFNLSIDQEGLSGTGQVDVDPMGPTLVNISFDLTTAGTLNGVPANQLFLYRTPDIASIVDLGVSGDVLEGVVTFNSQASENGAVVIGGSGFGGFTLDFTAHEASGFCFSAMESECFQGGGTSTGFEVYLGTELVPLPGALVLFATGIAGMAGLSRLRRRTA